MAQVTCNGFSGVSGSPFSNQMNMIRRTYDFALDGGATADTYKVTDFPDGAAVRLVGIVCKEACTSGGAADISVGFAAGTGTELAATIAISKLNAAGKFEAGFASPVSCTDEIEMSIGTAALTAGKLELIFEYFAL